MANLNKVMLIGRLTRDPESRVFANGGKVSKFGFAVNNRRKNQQTGQWEEDPVFLDVEAFNRGENGKMADTVEQYLRKGSQVFVEGHLVMDRWTAQDGSKRERMKVVIDGMQMLDGRQEGGGGGRSNGGGQRQQDAVADPADPAFGNQPPGQDDIPY